MKISNAHNLIAREPDRDKRYGIRVRMTRSDPLRNLLGDDWETFHWFNDAKQRDHEIREMSKRHVYSRIGDRPSLIFEAIER